jgi:hypothetical protein
MSRTPVKRLTETSIDKADSLIRDAQVTLSEFEKQIERGFSWWVRFADRDYASTLAERFENYFKSAKNVPGSIAWIVVGGMEQVGKTPLPKLDKLMRSQSKISRRKLRKVLKDRREEIAELQEHYRDERLSLRSKHDFALFLDAQNSISGQNQEE